MSLNTKIKQITKRLEMDKVCVLITVPETDTGYNDMVQTAEDYWDAIRSDYKGKNVQYAIPLPSENAEHLEVVCFMKFSKFKAHLKG